MLDRMSYLAEKQRQASLPKKKPVKWLVKMGETVYYEHSDIKLCNYYKKLHCLTRAVVKAVY